MFGAMWSDISLGLSDPRRRLPVPLCTYVIGVLVVLILCLEVTVPVAVARLQVTLSIGVHPSCFSNVRTKVAEDIQASKPSPFLTGILMWEVSYLKVGLGSHLHGRLNGLHCCGQAAGCEMIGEI
jgi:hypothetical protein